MRCKFISSKFSQGASRFVHIERLHDSVFHCFQLTWDNLNQFPGHSPQIPRSFPADSPVILRRFPADPPVIPRRFPADSPVIPRRFPGHSPHIPRRFPADSPVIPCRFPFSVPIPRSHSHSPIPRSLF